MRCDELKRRVYDGEIMTEEMWSHVGGCGECGEEFAPLVALRTNHPRPSAALRDRVMEGMPRPGVMRQVAAAAAAVLVALGVGYGFGRAHAAEPRVETRVERIVETVEVPVPHVADDGDVMILGIAASAAYGENVVCDYNGMNCREIRVDERTMKNYLPYCPIMKKIDEVGKQRPGLVKIISKK